MQRYHQFTLRLLESIINAAELDEIRRLSAASKIADD